MTLKIYNVMTRQKQEFVPLTPGAVKMYACGITVSADAHIGHAYQSVVFDVITRYFAYLGYNVKYVRNYTDVDDKIIANANKIGENPISFAERYMAKTDAEIDARAAAKAARDYATADAIRGELLTRGVTLMDSPSGTTWDIAL